MKIGLIGINKYAKFLNFACDLHAYAFQQFLQQHDYDATFIDYKPVYYQDFDMKYPAEGAEEAYRAAVRKKAKPSTKKKLAELAMGYRSVVAERADRFDKFDSFVQERLRFTPDEYDSDLLEIHDPGFDCYICVTDVIWQTYSGHAFDRGFVLGSRAFDGKPKISYAASRGAAGDFPAKDLELFSYYLSRFESVSVREDDFREYIETNTSTPATTVIDPVLLHDRTFWDEVAEEPREKGYVLLYYVMEQSTDTIAKAVEYAKQNDLVLVELSDRPFKYGKVTDPDVKLVPRYDVGMEEWLGYIRSADAVFTNSFHACCFSMLFEKCFFVGSRHGNKVPNFLATFGLSGQQFGPDTDVRSLNCSIDYRAARATLTELRKESSSFILEAVRNAESFSSEAAALDIQAAGARRRNLSYPVHFHSGTPDESLIIHRTKSLATIKRLKSGSSEYTLQGHAAINDGKSELPMNHYSAKSHRFVGWTLRFRIDNRWFWYLEDQSIEPSDIKGSGLSKPKMILPDGATIPHLPVNRVQTAVFTAQWAKDESVRVKASYQAKYALTQANQRMRNLWEAARGSVLRLRDSRTDNNSK